jgi:cell wall-associated NlpC family hydrolase
MTLDPRRGLIIVEALSFVGTPFHHAGMIKGVGVDCLSFIYLCYLNVGLVEPQTIPFYRPDFMRHQSEETYLNGLLKHGHEVKAPLPGDIAIYKWGRIFAHAGIVIDWPRMLHADADNGVIEKRGNDGRLRGKQVKFISMFDDGEAL